MAPYKLMLGRFSEVILLSLLSYFIFQMISFYETINIFQGFGSGHSFDASKPEAAHPDLELSTSGNDDGKVETGPRYRNSL